ncbi:hypothetical protein ACFHWD_05045 [Clostridium sp. MT-14]|uniref:Uncharacterized protein n=1 Tax=Clostridium aromativorans TaxID=2836848 RepID=A0ABS8N1M9_9CLOT|nr:hypothetical protein [Clostridium aromativorans]MCC9293683.1 hypothetical protein [Clostridium aromativorans]
MILQTNISVAARNSEGKYDIKNFSVFDVNKINESFTSLKISLVNNKILLLSVQCELCGNIHYFRYNINYLVRKDIIIGGCEILGFPILYIGNYNVIKNKILKYNEIKEKIYALI